MKKQGIFIHRVNNGYLIGVAKKGESSRIFDTSSVVKEIYACKSIQEVIEEISKLLPNLAKVDDMEVLDDD